MAFLTLDASAIKSVEKEGGSSYVTTSGIYDLTLKHAIVAGTNGGATGINYLFNNCNSYGNYILGKDGKSLFSRDVLLSLTAILGLTELADPEATQVQFKSKTEEHPCLPDLEGIEVKAWISFEYSTYNGEIKEKVSVKRFYNAATGATGSETLAGEGFGVTLEKDKAYADTVKYKDGLDAEQVKAWKASNNPNSAPKGNAAAAAGFGGTPVVTPFPTGPQND